MKKEKLQKVNNKELPEGIVRLNKTLEKIIERTRKPTKTRNLDNIDDRLNDQNFF